MLFNASEDDIHTRVGLLICQFRSLGCKGIRDRKSHGVGGSKKSHLLSLLTFFYEVRASIIEFKQSQRHI